MYLAAHWLPSKKCPSGVDCSSCTSDQAAVIENWYDVELAIWVNAACCDLVVVETSFLWTECRRGICIRKQRNSSVGQVGDFLRLVMALF